MQLGELAQALGLALEGEPGVELRGLAGLEDAGPEELSFVSGDRYRKAFTRSRAGAFLVPPDFDAEKRPCLRSPAPYADFGRAVELFLPPPLRPEPGVHPTAVVASDAWLGEDVALGAYVVVGAGARIGERTVIHPHCTLYANVQVGADCELHSGAHLREGVRLGDRVVVQNGAVIGADGFGFAYRADGTRVRIPHRCSVEVGDEAEIGSNSTIDASHPAHPRYGQSETRTRIGRAVKIDNLVQVAHGVEVGDGSTLCAFVGLAGGTYVGKHVIFGGASYAKGHVKIGDGSMVAGFSGVVGNLPAGSQVAGMPQMERGLYARVVAAWKRLPELLRRVRRIEDRLGIEREE